MELESVAKVQSWSNLKSSSEDKNQDLVKHFKQAKGTARQFVAQFAAVCSGFIKAGDDLV